MGFLQSAVGSEHGRYPAYLVCQLLSQFDAVGVSMAKDGVTVPMLIKNCAVPERLGPVTRFMMRLLRNTALPRLHWNRELKRHNALGQRDATRTCNQKKSLYSTSVGDRFRFVRTMRIRMTSGANRLDRS